MKRTLWKRKAFELHIWTQPQQEKTRKQDLQKLRLQNYITKKKTMVPKQIQEKLKWISQRQLLKFKYIYVSSKTFFFTVDTKNVIILSWFFPMDFLRENTRRSLTKPWLINVLLRRRLRIKILSSSNKLLDIVENFTLYV